MAIRNDLTINWGASPRLITIAAPSVEIALQDLLDTLRTLEAAAIAEPQIVDAAGKENLGGGVNVGLTVTLQNALLGFEARSGPDFTLCRISGGNLVALDANGDTQAAPVFPTDFVTIVMANSSSATLQEPSVEDVKTIIFGQQIEPGLTFLNNQRLLAAASAALISGVTGGTADEWVEILNAIANNKVRMRVLVDQYGNRKQIQYDLSD